MPDCAINPVSSMGRAWWHATLLLVCMVLLLQQAHGLTRQSGRGASVALTAKWNSTATVLEAAEFLVSTQIHPLRTSAADACCHAPAASTTIHSVISYKQWHTMSNLLHAGDTWTQADESPEQFWAFVDAWSSRGGIGEAAGGQDCWAQVVTAAAPHVPSSLGRLLPVVLASRQYSPRLELFATLAAEAAPSQQVVVVRRLNMQHCCTIACKELLADSMHNPLALGSTPHSLILYLVDLM